MPRILILFAPVDGQTGRIADRIEARLVRDGHAVTTRRAGAPCRRGAKYVEESKYRAFVRFMMRLIVGAANGDTDTSCDYEYKDWPAVEKFAAEFAARLPR